MRSQKISHLKPKTNLFQSIKPLIIRKTPTETVKMKREWMRKVKTMKKRVTIMAKKNKKMMKRTIIATRMSIMMMRTTMSKGIYSTMTIDTVIIEITIIEALIIINNKE